MNVAQSLSPAIQALRAGDRETARTLLLQFTEVEVSRADGWLWLAAASVDEAEKRDYLQRAWTLDPHDTRIIAGLRAIGVDVQPPAHAPVVETAVPVVMEETKSVDLPRVELPASLLAPPRFATTGVRAPRTIPWTLIALVCMIALLIPVTLWIV
jgi:hypothetical protein